jgi:phosphomevalonate kinase
MANKYQAHSQAKLSANLARNEKAVLDILDDLVDTHKERLDEAADRAKPVMRLAQQIYELLMASELSEQQRRGALQIAECLHRNI